MPRIVVAALLAGFLTAAVGLVDSPDSLAFLALIVVVVIVGLFTAERLERRTGGRVPARPASAPRAT